VVAFATAAAAGAAPASKTAALPDYQVFRSRPDLRPPIVKVLHPSLGTASGYLFIAPKRGAVQAGPMIFNNRGQLVWFRPLRTRGVSDLRVQRYRGRPVLTWWQARPTGATHGSAFYKIADRSYRTLAVVRPGNGATADPHEFLLTPRGTALMTTFRGAHLGGRRVIEGGVQEIDLHTSRVLFDWGSIDHVALSESYSKPPRDPSVLYDYFHINSIDVDTDGNLLVSARNTHAVYKIDHRTGRILWRLGGKRSDYSLGPGVRFAWQHDARRQPDRTISVFDNGAAPKRHYQSRVIFLHLNRDTMKARLVRTIVHDPPILAINQGNAQRLPTGGEIVGWGHAPYVTEYDDRGRVVLDLHFGLGADSYRAFRFPWIGRPRTRPVVAVDRGHIFVSWNGATEVARWQILTGRSPADLRPFRTVGKHGFETSAQVPPALPWLAVRALDRAGRTLGTSRTIHTR
jgi:arylsulfotransferase ASST